MQSSRTRTEHTVWY